MKITFLGHAGFMVETAEAVVVTDPWLSPTGAFDAAWFQFPRNHHLATVVRDRLATAAKACFVYVSHEHQDHLDLAFIESLRSHDLTVLVPDFRRPYLKDVLSGVAGDVVACGHGQRIDIPGGRVTLYLDDGELNRDSAILVEGDGRSFLDLNDCRIADALPMIAREHGVVDVFTCQYSGAGWHPTCYDYPREVYEGIARKKVAAKFRGVAQALTVLKPRLFLPSAGPPCFLDPQLYHLNLEATNIFPRAPRLLDYLDRRLPGATTSWADVAPGDEVDAASATVAHRAGCAVPEEGFADYMASYAASYAPFFAGRASAADGAHDPDDVLERLREEVVRKLDHLTLHERVTTRLYLRLSESERALRVDFPARTVETVTVVDDPGRYVVTVSCAEVVKVLDRVMTWDELSLSFRVRLTREPDVYQTVLQGFLRLEAENLERFCARLLDIEERQERIVVEAGARRFTVDRFCPHQGGDLRLGWVEDGRCLTCPRHQWQFDLEDGGRALRNDGSVHAVAMDGA